MARFISQRLVQGVFVLLVVGLTGFVLFRFAGDPVAQLVNDQVPAEQVAEIRRSLGLEDPLLVQYGRYLVRLSKGDFGTSYLQSRPVAQILAQRLPATVELAVISALLSLLAGIPMGVFAALRPNSPLANTFQAIALVGISLPSFFIGILLIFAFSVQLPILPSYGRGEVITLGWWTTGLLTVSGLKALVLPTVTLGLFQLTLIMRLVRSEMLEVLRMDFIRFARARGLSTRSIYFGHALKNALIPVLTVAGMQFGHIVAFAVITESVFQWPGLGLLFLQSLQSVDIPVMSTYLVLIGAFFVTINLVVDVCYFLVDPRLRRSGGGSQL